MYFFNIAAALLAFKMPFVVTAVLAMIVVLGFMILIHEFGHYAAAKFFGVRVEVFSIGFGTRLLGFRRGETDYRISAIPLGGYVKMSGENPMDERTGDPAEFLSHPRWQRFVIAVAGPAMNILLAFGLLTVVYMVHYEYPIYLDQPAVISWVEKDSPAAKAGLQIGDRIVHIDGIQNPTWEQVEPQVALSPNQPVPLEIERNGQAIQTSLVPRAYGVSQMGYAGWAPKEPLIVTAFVGDNMPAEAAGVKVGDEIIAMDGQPVPALAAMIDRLKVTKDQPFELTVLRDGKPVTLTVRPQLGEIDGGEKRYRIGVESMPVKVGSLPFAAAFQKSVEQNKQWSSLILELVGKLVRRKVSIRSVEGPIRIGQAAGEAATEKGWTPLLGLTAAISLNLGIFNLLPIPILDGGVILLLLIESVMRRDISLHIKERIYQAAFVFLLLFAATVIYNDLVKTLPGLSQRLP
jgi:regulator of sigma E protease